MAWFVRRNLFAGVAGACVVGLGIAMVWPIFSNYGDSRLFDDHASPEVTVELKPAADEPRSRAQPSRTEQTPEPRRPHRRPQQPAAEAQLARRQQSTGADAAVGAANEREPLSRRRRARKPQSSMAPTRDAAVSSMASARGYRKLPDRYAEALHASEVRRSGAGARPSPQSVEAGASRRAQEVITTGFAGRRKLLRTRCMAPARRKCRARRCHRRRRMAAPAVCRLRTVEARCGRRPRQVRALRRQPGQAGGRRAGVHVLRRTSIRPRTASCAGS